MYVRMYKYFISPDTYRLICIKIRNYRKDQNQSAVIHISQNLSINQQQPKSYIIKKNVNKIILETVRIAKKTKTRKNQTLLISNFCVNIPNTD